MENKSQNTVDPRQPDRFPAEHNRKGRVFAGLIVVIVGIIFLASKAGIYFPGWFFSYKTLLIALGLFIGFRHSFRGWRWFILIVIGTVLLMDDFFPYYDIKDYAWPLIIIAAGLLIIFRPGGRRHWRHWERENAANQNFNDDYIDSTVIFGGVKKNIISKNFRGGDSTTVFGGTEINLTQADVNGVIVLDITQIFGGTKIIVPPHWKIQSEDLVSIFGGLEDKRPLLSDTSGVDPNKVLVLKGTCIFGGIDIKSF